MAIPKPTRVEAYCVMVFCKYGNKRQSIPFLFEEMCDTYKVKHIQKRDVRSCLERNNSIFEKSFDDWKILDPVYENLDVEWIKVNERKDIMGVFNMVQQAAGLVST